MKVFKFISFFVLLSLPISAMAATSIFSTSTDWEAVTDLRLKQTMVEFKNDTDLVANGIELYFLDGFPCFGQTGKARIWIGKKKTDGEIRLTCLFTPKTLTFAYRNSEKNASQDKTLGSLTCETVGKNNITIDLSKCTKNPDWTEYK